MAATCGRKAEKKSFVTWRQRYAPMIAQIIKDNEDKSLKEKKRILRDANPGYYGWHRKTWANEYMVQLGLSPKKRGYKGGDKKQTELF